MSSLSSLAASMSELERAAAFMAAFVSLREERCQLADAMKTVGSSFRAFVHSQVAVDLLWWRIGET